MSVETKWTWHVQSVGQVVQDPHFPLKAQRKICRLAATTGMREKRTTRPCTGCPALPPSFPLGAQHGGQDVHHSHAQVCHQQAAEAQAVRECACTRGYSWSGIRVSCTAGRCYWDLCPLQIIDVLHPGRPSVSKVWAAYFKGAATGGHSRSSAAHPALAAWLQTELKEKLASTYDVKDQTGIFLFGFRTQASRSVGPFKGRRS